MTTTIRAAYSTWPAINTRLRVATAALTEEQLARSATPDGWPLWAILGHLACQRVFWLCDFAGEPGAAESPFPNAAYDCPGDDDLDHPWSADRLAAALDTTFAIVDRCLDTWTMASLDEVLRRPEWDGTWVKARGAVIQRVFKHDVSHVTDSNAVLATLGLPGIQLFD